MLTTTLILLFSLAAPPTATPVVNAVKSGDKATALRLIDARADVNAAESDGTTALHYAAQRDDVELVERLLRAGANAKAKNSYGSTPMAEAATLGSTAIIEKLLKAGADPESPNGDGQTALMLVARTGNVAAAMALIAHGANVNARERWHEQTALMWAVAQGQSAMAKALLAKGAEVNAVSKINEWKRQVTAEPRAVVRPVGGLTPLLFAAREGCVDCVAVLADAKADLNLPDPEGITPLLMALVNQRFDLANNLIDRGANIHKWDIFGRTPLYLAVDMNTTPRGGRPDGPVLDTTTPFQLVTRLLSMGANPNAQLKLSPPLRNVLDDRAIDRSIVIGATPLLRAAKALDAPAIEALLKHGALVNLPNRNNVTPVMVAAGFASVDADSRGLFTSADTQQRSIASLKLLVAAGANVNDKDPRGMTALHEAARWGWSDVVKFLIANGADVKVADSRGLTPVDSALGRAGGNSKFADRYDVFPETAAILKTAGAVEGRPNAPVGAPAGAVVGRDNQVPGAGAPPAGGGRGAGGGPAGAGPRPGGPGAPPSGPPSGPTSGAPSR